MKVILGFALLFIISASLAGFAFSENDIIPNWIKTTAGLWVEGEVPDQEFIAALEYLIESDIIQIDDPKIDLIESKLITCGPGTELDENRICQIAVESTEAETSSSTVIPQPDPTAEQYVMTDKQEYGLGDIIKVSGKFTVPPPTYGLDGSLIDNKHKISVSLRVRDDFIAPVDKISCIHVFEDGKKFQAGEYYYHDDDHQKQKCNIDDAGNFEFEFEVMNEYQAEEYAIDGQLIQYNPRSSSKIGSAFLNIG